MSASGVQASNDQLVASIVKSFPKDLGKEIVEALIDGEEVEWTETYQRPGGRVRTVSGKYRSHNVDLKKLTKKKAKDGLKKFLREADYNSILGNNLAGDAANWMAGGAEFVDKWYGVLKAAKTLATLSSGPVGLVIAAIEVYDGISDARSALAAYIDECGLEEHKRAGQYLQRTNALYDAIVEHIDWLVRESFKLEDDLEDARTNKKKVHDFWKGRPPSDSAYVRGARSRTLEQANYRVEGTMEGYAEHLRGFLGILMQAEMLRGELDRIVAHCDTDPLMYWGCSFANGHKNPNIGAVSFAAGLKPKIKNYTVTQWNDGAFGPSKKDIQAVVDAIQQGVRAHAIGAANMLDQRHLPRLRARAMQLADTLARWRKG